MTDLLEQAVAEAYAHVDEKSVVETVTEGLQRLSAFNRKVRYKAKVKDNGDTVFKIRMGFRKFGEIMVKADANEWTIWRTRGSYADHALSRDAGTEAVNGVADKANKRIHVVRQKSGGALSRAFSDTLPVRRENDTALDALVRGLDVLKSLGAPGNSFNYTVDCRDTHRTYLRTTAGEIEVVKDRYVVFVNPDGRHSAPIMRPTQARMLALLEEVATLAHNNGQIIPPNQSVNRVSAKQGKPKLIKGPQ